MLRILPRLRTAEYGAITIRKTRQIMKFARDCRSSESNEATAQLLFEALPWIKNLTGKTVVIKYGGAAMVDEQLRRDVMSDIVLLKIIGMRPVIVHGGGKAINEALSHYDIPVEFKNGQRVTTPATMDIVREVLGGKVNQELVAALNHHGNLAVGVSGSDAGAARPRARSRGQSDARQHRLYRALTR